MSAVFAEWQPRYADHNIATFPVTPDKVPAVKGYLRVGLNASDQLAMKFPANDAFGLACRRNRITVLDVDTPDERVLADGLTRHGQTPFIVRSGSGNFQAWYRHGGEKRRVRPDPERPIDILGDGFVVCPPSIGSKGQYQIIQGCMDDLDRLPRMKHPVVVEPESKQSSVDPSPSVSHKIRVPAVPVPSHSADWAAVQKERGQRNDTLFRRLLRAAHHIDTKEDLMQIAVHINNEFALPLGGDEVVKTTASAWRYKEQGRLFVTGGEATAVVFHSDVEHLWNQPLALILLVQLRMAHSWRNGGEFTLALAMADSLGVSAKTFRAARDVLVDRYFLEITHPGGKGKNDPPRVRLL